MQAHPEMMVARRSIVEHPFGNLKQWIIGTGRFLLKQLKGTQTEMALAVLAHNFKRVINIRRTGNDGSDGLNGTFLRLTNVSGPALERSKRIVPTTENRWG